MEILRLIIGWFFNILEFTILLECILSWVPNMRNSGVYHFVAKINNPFLSPVRKILFKCQGNGMGIDISPYVLFLLITFLRRLLWL